MTPRRLVLLAAAVLALPMGWLTWHLTRPRPVITWERAQAIRVGMTRAEVESLLGGPAGDYVGDAAVTYTRGSVGEDDTGFYQGTNWWGAQGIIQVQFTDEDRVESAAYYPAHISKRVGLRERLWASWPLAPRRQRHGWLPGPW